MKEIKTVKAKDIMRKSIIKISIDETICTAAKLMTQNKIGFLPVVNKNRLVGVVTDRDIVNRAISKEKDVNTPIHFIMTSNVITVNKNDDISIVISKMADNQIRRIIVTESEEIKGIIGISDIAGNTATTPYFYALMQEIFIPETKNLFLIKDSSIKI